MEFGIRQNLVEFSSHLDIEGRIFSSERDLGRDCQIASRVKELLSRYQIILGLFRDANHAMRMNAEEMVKTIVEELRASLATRNVIGEAIVLDDKILIPFTKFGLGFGSGAGDGGEGKQQGMGGGGGGGGGVEPVAAVVVFKGIEGPEGVTVLPLQKASPIAKAIGEILGGLMESRKKQKKEKTALPPDDTSTSDDRGSSLLREIQEIRSQLDQVETQLEEAGRRETSEA